MSIGNPNVNPWRIWVTVTAPRDVRPTGGDRDSERRRTHVGRGDDRLLGVVEQHRQIGRATRRQRRQLRDAGLAASHREAAAGLCRRPRALTAHQAADVAQAVAVRAAAAVHAARRAAAVPHPAGAVGIVQRARHHARLGDGAACRSGRCALGAAGGSGGRHLDRVGEPPCVALAGAGRVSCRRSAGAARHRASGANGRRRRRGEEDKEGGGDSGRRPGSSGHEATYRGPAGERQPGRKSLRPPPALS